MSGTTATTATSSTSGVSSMVSSSAAIARHKAAITTGAVDPIRELGLELEQRQYETRLLALTDPKAYAAERQTAFDDMVAKVSNAYSDAYDGFIKAGLSNDMAKNFALNAANNEKAVRRQVLETRFPTNANMIGDAQTVRESAGGNMLGARARAPARRRAKPRAPRRR